MPKTVKVRIAVAVDRNGDWGAAGDSNLDEVEAMLTARSWLRHGARQYWIEAELEVPEETTVEGTVSE